MRAAFFDCFSGVSGDMCLGAVVDAGAPIDEIGRRLRQLPVRGYRLESRTVRRAGISATKVDVIVGGRAQPARRWNDVRRIIRTSRLPEGIREQGEEIFRRLFSAEAKVHALPVSRVHLHELGAVDCLVDVFGTLIGLEALGVSGVCASALNLGSGTVNTAHGTLPVPAPATAELLKGVPVHASDLPFELTTPTGAAIISTLAGSFGPMPLMRVERTGYGAGGREIAGQPNVLRLVIGSADALSRQEQVTVIETNIDDMNPQVYEQVIDRLFAEGALDVFLSQIMMKKTRPAVKLSVLCRPEQRDAMIRALFEETTTIGVRHYTAGRTVMDRKRGAVRTAFGQVETKIARSGDIEKEMPEFASCMSRAKARSVPVLRVLDAAKKAAGTGKRK
ncbi:MAG: nickel pincer cofactor biosynthesis protein LarC [Thermodesulfovibrionales bacterium]